MSKRQIVVVYGSETGKSQSLSRRIHNDALQREYESHWCSLDEYFGCSTGNVVQWPHCPVVIVVSSTNEGDPPSNATKFWSSLAYETARNPDLPPRIALLGLGDSKYETFMGFPNKLHEKLRLIGAEELVPMGIVDDSDPEVEDCIDVWIYDLWEYLDQFFEKEVQNPRKSGDSEPSHFAPSNLATTSSDSANSSVPSKPTRDHPFEATIVSYRCLSEDREVFEFSLDLRNSGMDLIPGDAIGVIPENDPDLVHRLLSRLSPEGSDGGSTPLQFASDRASTLLDIFGRRTDINGPISKRVLRVLSESCLDANEKENMLALTVNQKDYQDLVRNMENVMDLLGRYPSCRPTPDALVDALSPLAPRYLSVASARGDASSFLFSLEKRRTQTKTFRGVATHYLKRKFEAPIGERKISVFARERKDFYVEDPKRNILMLSSGTGIAPFLGFLEQKKNYLLGNDGSEPSPPVGEALLLSGFRSPNKDHLYRAELEELKNLKVLDHLEVVLVPENDPNPTQHVHTRIMDLSELFTDYLFEKDAIVYICGGSTFLKTSNNTLKTLISRAPKNENDPDALLKKWIKEKKVRFDIW